MMSVKSGLNDMVVCCDICGKKNGYYEVNELRTRYQICYAKEICLKCDRLISKPINFVGFKEPWRIQKVKDSIIAGYKAQRSLSQLMNAGYF